MSKKVSMAACKQSVELCTGAPTIFCLQEPEFVHLWQDFSSSCFCCKILSNYGKLIQSKHFCNNKEKNSSKENETFYA